MPFASQVADVQVRARDWGGGRVGGPVHPDNGGTPRLAWSQAGYAQLAIKPTLPHTRPPLLPPSLLAAGNAGVGGGGGGDGTLPVASTTHVVHTCTLYTPVICHGHSTTHTPKPRLTCHSSLHIFSQFSPYLPFTTVLLILLVQPCFTLSHSADLSSPHHKFHVLSFVFSLTLVHS